MTEPATGPSHEVKDGPSLLEGLYAKILRTFRGTGTASEIARGASWSALVTGAGMALGFVTQLVLTRVLGDDGYGIYAYAAGWVTSVVMLTTVDFGLTGVRFIGAYATEGRWGGVRAYILEIGGLVLAISLLISVGAAAALMLFAGGLEGTHLDTYRIACVLFPAAAMLSWLGFVAQGLKRVVLAQAPSLVLRPILFLTLFVVVVALTAVEASPAVAVASNLVASVCAIVVAAVGLRKVLPVAARRAPLESELGLWLRTTLGLFGITVSQIILAGRIDVVVAGTVLGTREAGLYTLALLLGRLHRLPVEAISFISTPMIAETYARGRRSDMQRLLNQVYKGKVTLALPVIVLLVVGGRWLLSTAFGEDFAGAYPILLMIMAHAVQGVLLAGNTAGNVMSMTGHQNAAAVMVAVAAAAYVGLVGPLTLSYGAAGTAAATAVAGGLRNIQLATYIRVKLKLNVVPIPWRAGASADEESSEPSE